MYGYVCVYLSLIQGYLVRLYNIVICLVAIYLYNSFFFSLFYLLGLFDIILLLLLSLMLLLMLSPDHDNIFVYHCHCCQRLIFSCRFSLLSLVTKIFCTVISNLYARVVRENLHKRK